MGEIIRKILLGFLFCTIILSGNNTLQAQNDAFFYKNIEERDVYAFDNSMYMSSLNLFSSDGFSFNGFENGNSNDGFYFDNYDYVPDNAPLGNGLLVLGLGSVFYACLKRNRKEE